MYSGGFLFREWHQKRPSKIARNTQGSGCKVHSISAGKAPFFSEQEFVPNQWVGGADPYNARCFLPHLLAPKTSGPRRAVAPQSVSGDSRGSASPTWAKSFFV